MRGYAGYEDYASASACWWGLGLGLGLVVFDEELGGEEGA